MKSADLPAAPAARQGVLARVRGIEAPWLVVLAVAWLAFGLDVRTLMKPDETRYIGVAWEMLRSGHWLVPTLDGMPFFHKPPLFYWLSALSMQWFGVHDGVARLPAWLAASGVAASLYAFTRRWSGQGKARTALLALVTQPGFFIGAQFANLDMLVAGCIGMTLLAFAHAVLLVLDAETSSAPAGVVPREVLRAARRWVILAAAGAAFGMLAKGLIGVVLPGLVAVVWLGVLRRPGLLWRLQSVAALLVFFAIAAPWFLAMQQRFPGFFDYFFMEQHFRRFTGRSFNNVQPVWFYLPVLALIALPWSLWLPKAWGVLRRSWRSHAGSHDPATGQAARLLMWAWLGAMLVFFSMPSSKLVGYIFVVLPSLAWLAADASPAASVQAGPRFRLVPRYSIALAAAACLVVLGVLARYQPPDARVLAARLAALRLQGEPVFMVNRYVYDLGLSARLREPVPVVDNWNDPDLPNHDNWRKELADAGRFAPTQAARTLIGPQQLNDALCQAGRVWLVGGLDTPRRVASLQGQAPEAESGDVALWRLDAAAARASGALQCEGARRPEATP